MAAHYVLEGPTLGAQLAGIVWSEVPWRTLPAAEPPHQLLVEHREKVPPEA